MATTYTSLLGLALPTTGELSGTWGDVVDNYITSFLDSAVAGAQTISGTQTAVTLSIANGTALTQAGAAGTTGSSQYQIINCTGNPASTLVITVPSSSKTYVVINGTSTSQSVTIKGAATTGVTLVSGEKAVVAWNGSDFVKVASTVITNLTGTLPIANGGTGQTTASAAFNALSPITSTGDLILGNGTNSATRLPIGTNGYVLTSNGTTAAWSASTGGVTTFSAGTTGFTPNSATTGAITLAGTLAVANGGTGLTTAPTNGQIDIGSTGVGFVRTTLTAGTGISITNGAGSVTIATSGSSGTSIGLVRAISINCILP